jgi:hypothetical protein
MNWWRTHVGQDAKLHELVLGLIGVVFVGYYVCIIMYGLITSAFTPSPAAHNYTCVQVSSRVVCGYEQ